jgi:Flp pilus assembly protein TadG
MKRVFASNGGRNRERGAVLVEFSLVLLQLFLVMTFVFEIGRAVLVSTTVSHAARTGIRYAIVHGATRSGSGIDGPSGPSDHTQVDASVVRFAQTGLLSTSQLQITVAYPDATTNNPGSRVVITVRYPYDPFGILPFHANLGSTAEGIIAF